MHAISAVIGDAEFYFIFLFFFFVCFCFSLRKIRSSDSLERVAVAVLGKYVESATPPAVESLSQASAAHKSGGTNNLNNRKTKENLKERSMCVCV